MLVPWRIHDRIGARGSQHWKSFDLANTARLWRGSIIARVPLDRSHQRYHLYITITWKNSLGTKDYLVVGSDSGRIVILEYDPEKNVFQKLHQETYGKTGCRRYIPGQYLASDPRGRAFLVGAMERQKLVYIMNRDAAARLTISSPLEAHKSHTVIHSIVGVDVGFENPMFACLEMDLQDVDEDSTGEALENARKLLTYYELDLGLNHVVRKWAESVDRTANLLVPRMRRVGW